MEDERSRATTSGARDSQCGRSSWRQPGPAMAPIASTQASDTPASDEVSTLRQRVAQLEAENADLRLQVQTLSAQLV